MKTCPQCKMRYPNSMKFCFVEGAELAPLPDPRIGSLLVGRYVIEEVIGEGGMATVYRASQKLVERAVAIKVMNPILASDPIVRERFRREARSAQSLAHPNIIEIYDQGDTDDGTSFIVMELLRGESLAAVIRRGALDVDRAVHVMIQMARAIARAHDLEVIHRDLKPENIFLSTREDGTDLVKLLDFGIAKSQHDIRLTNQGDLFGTPQYMAPERILGDDTGGSSDLYALGVIFFEMLTGRLPFIAPDVQMCFVKHMNDDPPSLRSLKHDVPAALDALVLSLLAKSPKDRPVDAHRVHADLLEILRAREVAAPPAADAEPLSSSAPLTMVPGDADPWERRLYLLERMLTNAFGSKRAAPPNLVALLDDMNGRVRAVAALRTESLDAQTALEGIDLRGRDKRAQLGFAVDQLGIDASKSKEELRAARDAQAGAESRASGLRERYAEAHRELVRWEGRAGFAEPWPELAEAHRTIATIVDEWQRRREEERRAQAASETAERTANDLDFQLRELRAALAMHEKELDEEREKCRARIESNGNAADALETELTQLTAQICGPLRARPDLAALFRELGVDAGVAA